MIIFNAGNLFKTGHISRHKTRLSCYLQETYGEDPHLTGRLAVSFVRGLQGDQHLLKVITYAMPRCAMLSTFHV